MLVAEKTHFVIIACGSQSISATHMRDGHLTPALEPSSRKPPQPIPASHSLPCPREEREEQPHRQQDPAHSVPSAHPGTHSGVNEGMPPAGAGQQLLLLPLMTTHKLNM